MRAVCVWIACVGMAGWMPRVAHADEPAPVDAIPATTPAAPVPAAEPAVPPAAPAPAIPTEQAPAVELDTAPYRHTGRRREIAIEIPGERTRTNQIVIGGILGAGLIAGALGVKFHLDSRDASQAVESGRFTGEPWTSSRSDLVEDASRSRTRAIVAYSIGGAVMVGALVALIVTHPKSETTVIRTTAIPSVTPIEGGAVVAGMWSF